jgi:sarcosine oxidase, subunit gamma
MAKGVGAVERTHPLEGYSVKGSNVTVTPAAPAQRVSLRAPAASVSALSKALGVTLPQRPKTSAISRGGGLLARKKEIGQRAALWLGPDEWLVLDFGGNDPAADCADVKALHSAVDISHRNTAIIVEGAGAEATLNAGCPQDLSLAAFPAGACSRTVFGKTEIVLWRTAENTFRVECWRSFSDYVFTLLAGAARDASA